MHVFYAGASRYHIVSNRADGVRCPRDAGPEKTWHSLPHHVRGAWYQTIL